MQNFQHDLKYKIIVECKKYTKWKCKIRFPGETVVGYTHIYLHPKVQLGNNTEWSAIIYSGIVPMSTWRLVGWSSPSWSPSPLPSSFTDTRRRPPTGWTFSGNFKLQVWTVCQVLTSQLKLKFLEEKEEMEHLQAYNKKLLSNILPVHVAEFFMSGDKNNDVNNWLTFEWVLYFLLFRSYTTNSVIVVA